MYQFFWRGFLFPSSMIQHVYMRIVQKVCKIEPKETQMREHTDM